MHGNDGRVGLLREDRRSEKLNGEDAANLRIN
jgi:arylamine N-acetyltransferase